MKTIDKFIASLFLGGGQELQEVACIGQACAALVHNFRAAPDQEYMLCVSGQSFPSFFSKREEAKASLEALVDGWTLPGYAIRARRKVAKAFDAALASKREFSLLDDHYFDEGVHPSTWTPERRQQALEDAEAFEAQAYEPGSEEELRAWFDAQPPTDFDEARRRCGTALQNAVVPTTDVDSLLGEMYALGLTRTQYGVAL